MDEPTTNKTKVNSKLVLQSMSQQDTSTNYNADMANNTPYYGLLSQTIVHSPVVSKILTARIRQADLNDVVFIGLTFIEIHLLTSRGILQKVGCKADFHAEIRAANAFGSRRKSSLSGVQNRDVAAVAESSKDSKIGLPADILVISLDSGHLAFIYAKNYPIHDGVDFVLSTRRVGSRGLHPKSLGASIAVDPFSRAMAINAYQDSFRMYALHSMDEIHRQMSEGLPLNPVKEERTFQLKGCFIVHMEFLYPSPTEPDHVILVLFVVDAQKKPRLQLYEWWASKSLQTASRHGHRGLCLPEEVSMPIHLIPLVISSAFLLVTECFTHVITTLDIMSGNAIFEKVPILPCPTNGHRQSLVTAWSRPFRHPEYSDLHDDMYIALENGDIYFLEVDSQAEIFVQTVTRASQLDCSIGGAFAVLDFGLAYDDVLIAGGEMSSGGIYMLSVGPYPVRRNLKLEASVANWAPVFDFELVNMSAHGQVNGIADRDRIFACTGRAKYGAITELRYGIQAATQEPVEYLQGVHRLFVLPDKSSKGYFLLSTLPGQSFLCFLSSLEDREWYDCDEITSLQLEETTLTAGAVEWVGKRNAEGTEPELWTVQITPTMITATQLFGDDLYFRNEAGPRPSGLRPRLQQKCNGGDVIIAGGVCKKCVLIALRNGPDAKLILASFAKDPDINNFLIPIGAPVALIDNPTFVNIIELQDRFMAIVGTRQATIQIFLCDMDNGLAPIREQSMMETPGPSQDDLWFCESAVVLSTDTAAKLLCGLRGGTVLVFDMTISWPGLQLNRSQVIRFGPIPVQLHLDARRKDSAYVLAGPEVYRFDIPHDKFRATQLVFDRLTEVIDPSIKTVVQVDNSPEPDNTIICVTKDQIFYADVSHNGRVFGRRLTLGETPRKLLLYKPLGVLVVACTKAGLINASGTEQRQQFCTLKIIDPKTGNSRIDGEIQDSVKGELIFGRPNEQILSMAVWIVQIDNKKYQYIAVGTGITGTTLDGIAHNGRVVIISLHANARGMIDTRKRFQILCDHPIYSVASYGTRSMVFCSGTKLFMKRLNFETRKLDPIAETGLRSPAVHLSVSEPYCYLSCSVDSVLVVRFDAGVLTKVFSDEAARNGLYHETFLNNVIIATDKQYSIVGLWQPVIPRNLQSLKTMFEAELSSSISRLRRGICRPPWIRPTHVLPGVVSGYENIIAAGIDGSFYQLTLLSKPAVELLRYVLELHRTQSGGQMHLTAVPGSGILTDLRHRDAARAAHIDGDLFKPVIDAGAAWLKSAVEKDEASGPPPLGGGSAGGYAREVSSGDNSSEKNVIQDVSDMVCGTDGGVGAYAGVARAKMFRAISKELLFGDYNKSPRMTENECGKAKNVAEEGERDLFEVVIEYIRQLVNDSIL